MRKENRLVLGTAQLGMQYGIANRTGKPSATSALAVVRCANEQDIIEYDTAQAYGDSEQVLGYSIAHLGIGATAKIISKIHPSLDPANKHIFYQACQQSIERLNCGSLYGLLLHRQEQLDSWDRGASKVFARMKERGMIRYAGVSVYSPVYALRAIQTPGIDIVQLPNNLLDRRFEHAEIFKHATDAGKTIYIRSVLLQGLLLMNPDDLPPHMQFAAKVMDRLRTFASETGHPVAELAFGYLKESFPQAKIMFGAETPEQVAENVRIWNRSIPQEIVTRIRTEFEGVDEMVLNPAMWPGE